MSFVIAAVVASVAAAIYFPALTWCGSKRFLIWILCFGLVATSPCLVPIGSPWRFVSSLIAVALLAKLYDAWHSGEILARRGLRFYLIWLANPFWLVSRQVPPPSSLQDDRQSIPRLVFQLVASLILFAAVFAYGWQNQPFFLEHCAKVIANYAVVMSLARTATILWRLAGGLALEPMLAPVTAATPADFWRRWNLPAQAFFETYVYRPAGGLRDPCGATLVTFAVSGIVHEYVFGIAAGQIQGWQMLFFLCQGMATIGAGYLHPGKAWRRFGQLVTIAFNLFSSVLFFQSVNAVLPFYAAR